MAIRFYSHGEALRFCEDNLEYADGYIEIIEVTVRYEWEKIQQYGSIPKEDE